MNADEQKERVVPARRLAELVSAEHSWDFYARLLSFKQLQTKENKPFLVVELADLDTVIEAKVWGDRADAMTAIKQLPLQTPVKVRGQMRDYRGQPQLVIDRLRAVAPEDPGFDPAQLIDPALERVEDLACKTLVIDIETVPAHDRQALPDSVLDALTKYALRKEPNKDEPEVVDSLVQRTMSFSPFFSKIVSLALGDGDAEPGSSDDDVTVLAVPAPDHDPGPPPPWLRLMSEPELLRCFWALASKAEVVVTFNGRSFDVPFLVTRSLIHGIPARRDLLGNRFAPKPHLDLFELLGQRDRGPSKLDVIYWALGIASPKGDMDGSMVAPTYARGEILKIAEYNAHDVRATAAIYRKVRDLVLRFRADWT